MEITVRSRAPSSHLHQSNDKRQRELMRDSQSNKNRLREVMFLDSEDDSLIGGDQGDETFDDSENDIKNRPLKESHKHRGRTRKKTNPRIFLISLAINAVLSALLFASWTYTASLKKVISLKEGRCNSDMYPADLRSYIDVEEPWCKYHLVLQATGTFANLSLTLYLHSSACPGCYRVRTCPLPAKYDLPV